MPPNYNIPGITYDPITYKNNNSGYIRPGTNWVVQKPKKFAENQQIIDEYTKLFESMKRRVEEPKVKAPLWKRLAKPALTALKYTSVSELATKLPVIGEPIEQAMDYVPGVRLALNVATNPISYIPGGLPVAAAGAAGAGLGAWAFSPRERGLNLPMPLVPKQYKEAVGGTLGALTTVGAVSKLSALSAAKSTAEQEANIARIASGKLQADDILYTTDRAATFTPNRPPADISWHEAKVNTPKNFVFDPKTSTYIHQPPVDETLTQLATIKPTNQSFSSFTENVPQTISTSPLGFRKVARGVAQVPGKVFSKQTAAGLAGAAGLGYGASALGLGGPPRESISQAEGEAKGFWEKVVGKTGEILAPAIDPWVNVINEVYEALPEPVQEKLTAGTHKYQEAIDTVISPITSRIDKSARWFTGHTIDPVVMAVLPDHIAQPIVDAIDFAGSLAPYIALAYITGGTSLAVPVHTALAATFGLEGISNATKGWEAYKQGQIGTGDFLINMGFSALMIKGLAEAGKIKTRTRKDKVIIDPETYRSKMNEAIDTELAQPNITLERVQELNTFRQTLNQAIDEQVRPTPVTEAAVQEQAGLVYYHGTTTEGAQGIGLEGRIRPTKAAVGTMPGVYLHELPETALISARTSAKLANSTEAVVPAQIPSTINIASRVEVDTIKNNLGLTDTPSDMQKLVNNLVQEGFQGADISAQLGDVKQNRIVIFDGKIVKPTEEIPFNILAKNVNFRDIKTQARYGRSYIEAASIASKDNIDLIDSSPKFKDTDFVVTSRHTELEPVVEFQRNHPSTDEWLNLQQQNIRKVKSIFERSDYRTPDTDQVEYGGIVSQYVAREDVATKAAFNVTPEKAFITDNPLAHLDYANYDELSTPAKRLFDDVTKGVLKEGETVNDVLIAASMTNTPLHEFAHRVILGHETDFDLVLKNIYDTATSAELSNIFNSYRDLLQTWKKRGDLKTLEEVNNYVSDILRGTTGEASRATAEITKLAADYVRRAGERIEQPPSGAGDIGGVLQPVAEAGAGLESIAPSIGGILPGELAARGIGRGREVSPPSGIITAGEPITAELGKRPERRVIRVGPEAQRLTAEGKPSGKEPVPEQRVGVSERPPALESTKSYEVLRDNYDYNTQNVDLQTSEGIGQTFINAGKHAEKVKTEEGRLFTPLPEIKEIMINEFRNNYMKRVAEKAPWLAEKIGGAAAAAATKFEKILASYHILRSAANARSTFILDALRSEKSPWDEYKAQGELTGTIKVTDVKDVERNVKLDDVLSNPSKYPNLTTAQKGYVQYYQKIVDDHVQEMLDNGVPIRDLGVEKRGEHYIPRAVIGKDGIILEDLDRPLYGGKQIGGKKPFEKPRHYATMAEGEAAGVIYAHPLEALQLFVNHANNKIVSQKVLRELDPYGKTARELALEDVGYIEKEVHKKGQAEPIIQKEFAPLAAARAERRKAWLTVKEVQKELNAAIRIRRTAGIGLGRKLSIREVTSLANADKEIIKLRKVAEKARIKKTEGWEELQTELKTKVQVKRDEIRQAHNLAREGKISEKSKIEEEVRERLDAAKEKFNQSKFHFTRVAREMSSIVKAKAGAITATTEKLTLEMIDVLGMENDIRPVGLRSVNNIPVFRGKLFPEPIARAIEKTFNEGGISGIKIITDVNDAIRLVKTSTDAGHAFIQGTFVLATSPKAWAQSIYHFVQSIHNVENYFKWRNSKLNVINEAYPYIGSFGSEYFSLAPGTNRFTKWAKTPVIRGHPEAALTLAKKGIGTVLTKAGVGFEAFLDSAKILLWESFAPFAKTEAQKVALGQFIRNLTGTTDTARLGVSTGQRQLESLLLFSPRFTRSASALLGMAALPGPMQKQALKSIATLLGGAVFIYAGVKQAAYQAGMTDEPFNVEDLNPANGGRFMSVKIGNNYYGLGGSFRGVLQLFGNLVAAGNDPQRFTTLASSGKGGNPFLTYLRTRASPGAGSVIDGVTGKTYLGEDTTDRLNYIMKLPDQFIPFALDALMSAEGEPQEKVATLLAQGIGMRTYPESPAENLDLAVRKFTGDAGNKWSDLTGFQKSQLLQEHPEVQSLLDKRNTKNWNDFKQINLEAEQTKAELGMRWMRTMTEHNGEKVTNEDLTSKEYRDALTNINLQLNSARAVLGGGNPFTGQGGEIFTGSINTPRQKLMNAYYEYVNKSKYVRPDGTFDFDMRDKLISEFMSQLTPEYQKIVIEETSGTTVIDPIEKRLREAQVLFRPYWDIRDEISKKLGYTHAYKIPKGSAAEKRYNKQVEQAQERFRLTNPDVDKLLTLWGYVSKTMQEREKKSSKVLRTSYKNPYAKNPYAKNPYE